MKKEELLKRFKEITEKQLSSLELGYIEVSELPSEIGQLNSLRRLELSCNNLSELPSEIGSLYSLESLHVQSNKLTKLPPEIGNLTCLKSLEISSNNLSSLPPEIGNLVGLELLDVSSNNLSSLPPEIGNLVGLELLDVSSNNLNNLPIEIGLLANLKYLKLNFNNLVEIPSEIGQLVNLIALDARANRISEIHPAIGCLLKLEALRISDNRLIKLPLEIGNLISLKSLSLNTNRVEEIPSEIGQLINLKSLGLSFNQFIDLPPEVGDLAKLEYLNLQRNKLIRLLPEIGRLSNLNTLDLSNNKLTQLPVEISQADNLESLDLSKNKLNKLSSKIGQFSNLRSLNLSDNELSSLPLEVGQIDKLEFLYIRANNLNGLPAELGQLYQLKFLDLRGNQLNDLPPEIRRYVNDPEEAAQQFPGYYRQILEQKTEHLFEAKLLILGEGGAGKTSLAKKIEDEKYILDSSESSTKGIDIIRWKFLLQNGKDFRVNIWDFGGQEIYHSTHQFFLTKRSLYILVADSRREDTDFFYWLSVVDLLSEASPILIIKNEKQDRRREINERQLRGEFTNLEKILETNLATNRGLPEIKHAIQQYIMALPHVGTELPKTWVKVRQALEDNPHSHTTLEEYLCLCKNNGFTRREDALQLSGYLHDLGVCLHFQDDDLLRKTVILKPTWGTDAVYKVLDNPLVVANLGKFNRDDLASIWYEDKYSDMLPELLRLMMNFKLCYEIPGSSHVYIAPQLLSLNQPEYDWDKSSNLLLRYSYEFMPKGILTRFIVEMHQWIEDQTCVWKTGVVLSKGFARAEIIEFYHRKEIRVRISGNRRRDLLTTVRHELDKIHSSYDRLKSKTLVPCNCSTCRGTQEPFFYPFDKLQERLANSKKTIECGNPPYLDVSILPLIDDITRPSDARDQVFISYSHLDEFWLDQLKTQIDPLVRHRIVTLWDKTQIEPGSDWSQDISKALAAAKVAVLLVSPNFLASDLISNKELPNLLNAGERDGLTIIWIPISYSLYEETAIVKYQPAHSPNQPLDSLSPAEQNKAWVNICKKIKSAYQAQLKN